MSVDGKDKGLVMDVWQIQVCSIIGEIKESGQMSKRFGNCNVAAL